MFNAVVIYREISATEYFPDRYWKNYLDFHELQCWVDGKNINSLSSIGSSDNVRITSDNINWTSNYQIPSLDSHRVASNGINEVIDLSNDEDNVRGYSLGNNMNEPLHFIVKHDTLYKVKDLEAVVLYMSNVIVEDIPGGRQGALNGERLAGCRIKLLNTTLPGLNKLVAQSEIISTSDVVIRFNGPALSRVSTFTSDYSTEYITSSANTSYNISYSLYKTVNSIVVREPESEPEPEEEPEPEDEAQDDVE